MTRLTTDSLGPGKLATTDRDILGRRLPHFDEPVRDPIGTSPPCKPQSVRRTMTLEFRWPDGPEGLSSLHGRARDIVCDDMGESRLLGEAAMTAALDRRNIVSIDLPTIAAAREALAGLNAGGELRKAFNALAPDQRKKGTLLHLMVDDMAGASLVSRWTPNFWHSLNRHGTTSTESPRRMEGLCIGFRPGSDALLPDGRRRSDSNVTPIPPLINRADPDGWHAMCDDPGMQFRRARRVDIWRTENGIAIECHFQDSSTHPSGGLRVGIHEYALTARITQAGLIKDFAIRAGTLPFAACRAAPANIAVLEDTPVHELRENVARYLKGTSGCTHLNDVMRSLADVPVMTSALP